MLFELKAKKIKIIIGFLLLPFFSFSQKKHLDFDAFRTWPSISSPSLSNDGKFVAYSILNQPVNGQTLIIQSTNDTKAKRFSFDYITPIIVSFTSDSKFAIFSKVQNTLSILKLDNLELKELKNVKSFQCSQFGKSSWIIYETDKIGELVLYNIASQVRKTFFNTKGNLLSKDGTFVIIKHELSNKSQELLLFDLKKDKTYTIWKGRSVKNLNIKEEPFELAFLSEYTGDSTNLSQNLCWYKRGVLQQIPISELLALTHNKKLIFDGINSFTPDGKGLYFSLKERDQVQNHIDKSPVSLDIWTYLDTALISQQKLAGPFVNENLWLINFENRNILQIEDKENKCIYKGNKLAIVYNDLSRNQIVSQPYKTLINLKTGEKKRISLNDKVSPSEQSLIYFDIKTGDYIKRDVPSAKEINLTKDIRSDWYALESYDRDPNARGLATWINNGKQVIVYDKYDLWKFDLDANTPPLNLTNAYGSRHKIIFYLLENSSLQLENNRNGKLIMIGFNTETKESGFYAIYSDKRSDPELLSKGQYIFEIPLDSALPPNSGFMPIKAKDANLYLVRRESATEFPNYFSTTDFKTFKQLSHLNPQKEYNWYKTELHSWKSLDGRALQGILYKPENFDPAKKYPVIFHYYEKKSDGLNAFISPALSNGDINIPYYVSNGYLVFTPDIHYKFGDPMQGTFDAVVSAAKYVSKMPYVESTKMAIQSWSFGGWQTNYLVTHTRLFAAAAESAGPTDIVSMYGDIWRNGTMTHDFFKKGQGRMAGSLWDKPEMYIKNSPIFNADKVTTPLLMMHNEDDRGVLFDQALELFTALYSLKKPVWLLQYDRQGHGVYGEAAKDFTIRLKQFFDHYLMDKPAPIWMTRGIPASKKGIETGLELDTVIKTPGPGLLDTNLSKPPQTN